jgi:arylsulfatase A-like enzyme
MAEMLKEADYATGAFGKWGLGSPGSEGDPNKQGFDEFYGYNCQSLAHNYYPGHLWDNQTKIILEGNSGDQFGEYAPEMIHQRALQFIEKNRDTPIAVNLRNLDLSNDPGSLFFSVIIGGYAKAQYYLLKDHWKMFLLLKS